MVKYVGEDGEPIKPEHDPNADPPEYMTEPGDAYQGPPRPISPISSRPPPEPDPPEYMTEPGDAYQGPPRPMSPISARPPEILQEPGSEAAPAPPPSGPSLQGEDLDGLPPEIMGGPIPRGRPGPFKAGCIGIPVVLIAILLVMWLLTDQEEAVESANSTSTSVTTSTTEQQTATSADTGGDDVHYNATAPAEGDLPAGEELYTGESGDNIGYIARDGQSRFLSITGGPGVGVGNGAIPSKSTLWPKGGKITGFGVKLGANENPGRYGFNIFINGETYSAGCAMEVGQTSCFAVPENIEGTPPIQVGEQLTIIIGEQGHVEAEGDFPVTWWMSFKPS